MQYCSGGVRDEKMMPSIYMIKYALFEALFFADFCFCVKTLCVWPVLAGLVIDGRVAGLALVRSTMASFLF